MQQFGDNPTPSTALSLVRELGRYKVFFMLQEISSTTHSRGLAAFDGRVSLLMNNPVCACLTGRVSMSRLPSSEGSLLFES